MYLIGQFNEQDALEQAIHQLRGSGFKTEDLDLFSEEPVEFRRGVLDRPSRMSLVAVSGAAVLGTLATWFVYYAQRDYPLVTGGMPVFSFWATGTITYEMTMLGAVLSTFACFLWESGLLRKRDTTAPVPLVEPGAMCLRVRCSAEQSASANAALVGAGAVMLKVSK